MPTDHLTTAKDHPAAVLRSKAMLAEHPDATAVFQTGAATLVAYEAEHGVTFVALHNDALQAVADLYEKHIDTPYVMDMSPAALRDLLTAVNALLGLGDD